MKIKTKCNIIRYTGNIISAALCVTAFNLYGSDIANKALMVPLLIIAAFGVTFLSAVINTNLEHNENKEAN